MFYKTMFQITFGKMASEGYWKPEHLSDRYFEKKQKSSIEAKQRNTEMYLL